MKLEPVQRWWQKLNLREQLLVLVSAIAALALALDTAVSLPLDKRLKGEHGAVQALQNQLEQARRAVATRAADQAAAPTRDDEERLRDRLVAAQAATAALQVRAAEAARLPEVLRTITGTVGAVRLLSLELGADAATPAEAASAPVGARRLYRLPITLKVSGSYEELQRLLTQIGLDAQALQWSALTLDNTEWPAIQLTLKAHVLSLAPRWGGAL